MMLTVVLIIIIKFSYFYRVYKHCILYNKEKEKISIFGRISIGFDKMDFFFSSTSMKKIDESLCIRNCVFNDRITKLETMVKLS